MLQRGKFLLDAEDENGLHDWLVFQTVQELEFYLGAMEWNIKNAVQQARHQYVIKLKYSSVVARGV